MKDKIYDAVTSPGHWDGYIKGKTEAIWTDIEFFFLAHIFNYNNYYL